MATFKRVSPGMYRNTSTGKIIKSATPPVEKPAPKPVAAKPVATQPQPKPQPQPQPQPQPKPQPQPQPQPKPQPQPTSQTQPYFNKDWEGQDVAGLEERRRNTVAEIHRLAKTDPARANAYKTRLAELDKYLVQRKRQQQQTPPGGATDPGAGTPPPGGETPAPPTSTPVDPAAEAEAKKQAEAMWGRLFPEIQAFDKNQFYTQAQDEAKSATEAWLASRGLTGSTAESESLRKARESLQAQEGQRVQGLQQQGADRLERVLQNAQAATRGDRQDQWGMIRDVLDLSTRNDPMSYIYGATGKAADTAIDAAGTDAKYAGDMYKRIYAGGGGGGSAGPGNFIPPFPSGPNMSGIDLSRIMAQGGNNTDLLNVFTRGISGLFSGGK